MIYYTCMPDWESMLSCIFDAWSSGKGHQNIRLLLEPIEQMTFFDEYIHVDADPEKVNRVINAVRKKISPYFYRELAFTSLAYEEDALDNIYRCMILGFAYGPRVLEMVQYRDIMRNRQIRTRLGKEVNRFQEFMRFYKINNEIYVAHFEPKSRIAIALGPIFEDRMPSEHWMIIDDIHKEAIVHPKDEHFYMRTLSGEEFERLLETEKINDEYTDLWRTFFHTIAIQERKNERCQKNLYPLWSRKHAVEFMTE